MRPASTAETEGRPPRRHGPPVRPVYGRRRREAEDAEEGSAAAEGGRRASARRPAAARDRQRRQRGVGEDGEKLVDDVFFSPNEEENVGSTKYSLLTGRHQQHARGGQGRSPGPGGWGGRSIDTEATDGRAPFHSRTPPGINSEGL